MIDEDQAGRILREIGTVRTELGAIREQSDKRHRTIANEMAEIRALAGRANDAAQEAKRVADRSAYDTTQVHTAVVEHTRGLAEAMQRQDRDIEAIKRETAEQTKALETQARQTQGLADAMRRQDCDIEAIKVETGEQTKTLGTQTASLATLLKAEDERKIREDALTKASDERWKKISRWWPIATAAAAGVVTIASYLVTHWKP